MIIPERLSYLSAPIFRSRGILKQSQVHFWDLDKLMDIYQEGLMNIIEAAKDLIQAKEIEEESGDFLLDAIGSINGDCIALARLMLTIAKAPFFISNKLFWVKFERFLQGVYMDEDSRLKMGAKLASIGDRNDNAIRLLSVIEYTDSLRKIDFLINASRCLQVGFISLPLYFRICQIVSSTVLEDLLFLRDHINDSDLPYTLEIQGLLSSGLMYMSHVGEEPAYSFTPIALEVDRYAVSYEDVDRYPNPIVRRNNEMTPAVTIPTLSFSEIDETLTITQEK